MTSGPTESTVTTLGEGIRSAAAEGRPLRIRGGGTKAFSEPPVPGEPLDTGGLRGIVDYEPTELVVTVRAGTPLAELQDELAAAGQMLACEPPAFGSAATVGGTVACGLAGPRRPYAGALRDFVLGVRCLNGRGEDLRFGGRVMKNVAGYDIARLMAGARGTLGVLLEISFKVLPLPEIEQTLSRPMAATAAITYMNELAGRPLPLSAAAWYRDTVYVRFSGSASAVAAAARDTGMTPCTDGEAFWQSVREQELEFFGGDEPVWRLSLPATAALPDIEGSWFIDWGGAQRWLRTQAPAGRVQEAAASAGGYALPRRGGAGGQSLPALSPALLQLQQRLKQAFDPAGILNPGLLYTGPAC